MWSIYNQIQFAYDRFITFIHYHTKLGKIQCTVELVNLSNMFFLSLKIISECCVNK